MVFCAYCGNEFTRKEHLERHLPTHTNVKPYRCSDCQLDFSRRDMLQRHYSQYHEEKGPMERSAAGSHTAGGRSQIACLNCAQAKTGCDKQFPSCSRCREKSLTCEARYARRQTKNATRAAAAAAAKKKGAQPVPQPVPQPIPKAVAPVMMDIDHSGSAAHDMPHMKPTQPGLDTFVMDPRIVPQSSSPNHLLTFNTPLSPDDLHTFESHFTYPPNMMGNMSGGGGGSGGMNDMIGMDTMCSSYHDFPWNLGSDFVDMNNGFFNGLDITTNAQGGDALLTPIVEEITPMSTPLNRDRRVSGSTHPHSRSTSITSTHSPCLSSEPKKGECDIIIEAEAGWPLARCTPVLYSGNCPQTAIHHLERLEQKSRCEGTWLALEAEISGAPRRDNVVVALASPSSSPFSSSSSSSFSVVPMRSQTRDQLLAISQTFLQKALEIHRRPRSERSEPLGVLSYVVLPPLSVLDFFMQNYVCTLSLFYSLVPARRINPNEMIEQNQASHLLLLLMIAQGASVVSSEETRALSTALIETCRISLFDMIEKNVDMCSDSTVHRCALLFTLLGAWSGDKWLMDIAMGQRGMYTSMLIHAGMFESLGSTTPPSRASGNGEIIWRSWLEQETKNRLVYNWVMVDQELSLFHDTAPMLDTQMLCAPLPGPDELWLVGGSEQQWMVAWQGLFGTPQFEAVSRSTSLCTLFGEFVNSSAVDNPPPGGWTSHQLRLLLQPLQLLQWQLRQASFYVGNINNNNNTNIQNPVASAGYQAGPFEDRAQTLFQKWHGIAKAYADAHPSCVATKTNFVLYHLLSLNDVTDFPSIERLARLGMNSWEPTTPSTSAGPCVRHSRQAMYHCGQVIQLVRGMPAAQRPVWWSAAIYRAMLVLWANSVLMPQLQQQENNNMTRDVAVQSLDVPIDSAALTSFNFNWAVQGNPVLTASGDGGAAVRLDNPSSLLAHAVSLLELGGSSRLTDGIKRKLKTMKRNWEC